MRKNMKYFYKINFKLHYVPNFIAQGRILV